MDVRIFLIPKPRTSADHQSKRSAKYEETRRKLPEETRRAKYEKTRRGDVDYRIQGTPHSTAQKEDSNRPSCDPPTEDPNKTEERNPFSEKYHQHG